MRVGPFYGSYQSNYYQSPEGISDLRRLQINQLVLFGIGPQAPATGRAGRCRFSGVGGTGGMQRRGPVVSLARASVEKVIGRVL
uniref:Uncharacterized protein n=1 Tax=Chromera velia CCMP2878 TaxID=1169474 RepID=A0A0G4FHJ7_9ALVE|eukprot:Cvel_16974.t1-p1 / transcript=Cvel_16974.t1 / gene=Cvel_16974 / organism=Chromera_velia_CCMP2878 / gene_product=hypothetical protein / transcript_product=hypothetical protein / location=Cvel_scaffold1332:45112-45735(-) / protein_length=83 / sequence_SO=supercontig / SO=protein_coding / is_pseudo=false